MRTIETKIYKYDELTEAQKQKVLDRYSYINTDHDWFDGDLDYFKGELDAIGFEDAQIYFSGFGSQGEGACFDARINKKALIASNPHFKALSEVDFSVKIEQINSHYSHENARRIESVLYHGSEEDEELLNLFVEFLETLRLEWCNKIYVTLRADWEYLSSREAIEETIRINEYEFYEDGRIA